MNCLCKLELYHVNKLKAKKVYIASLQTSKEHVLRKQQQDKHPSFKEAQITSPKLDVQKLLVSSQMMGN